MDASKQIIKAISDRIKYKRSDTILNHLKTYFQHDTVNYSGICYDKYFTIWRYSQWVGLFYVVIYGQILLIDNKTKVTLKSRPNIVGLILALIIFLGFFLGFNNFRIQGLTISDFFMGLFVSALPILAIGLGVFSERNKFLSDISEIIKKENEI